MWSEVDGTKRNETTWRNVSININNKCNWRWTWLESDTNWNSKYTFHHSISLIRLHADVILLFFASPFCNIIHMNALWVAAKQNDMGRNTQSIHGRYLLHFVFRMHKNSSHVCARCHVVSTRFDNLFQSPPKYLNSHVRWSVVIHSKRNVRYNQRCVIWAPCLTYVLNDFNFIFFIFTFAELRQNRHQFRNFLIDFSDISFVRISHFHDYSVRFPVINSTQTTHLISIGFDYRSNQIILNLCLSLQFTVMLLYLYLFIYFETAFLSISAKALVHMCLLYHSSAMKQMFVTRKKWMKWDLKSMPRSLGDTCES